MMITVGGVKTQYQHIGKHGPMVILLHGWGQDWQSWSPLIPALSDDHQLVVVDLPAFGGSEAPQTPWSSWEYAQWFDAFLQEVVPSDMFTIIGHSFGAKIAAVWAGEVGREKRGESLPLNGLVLIDSAGLPVALTLAQKVVQNVVSVVPEKIKEGVSVEMRRRLLTGAGAATDHLNSTKEQRAILKVIVREDISQILPKITVPTLLIWGENDQDTPISKAKAFSTGIPNNQLYIIPGAGHFVFKDQPQVVLSHLLPFLKSVTIK